VLLLLILEGDSAIYTGASAGSYAAVWDQDSGLATVSTAAFKPRLVTASGPTGVGFQNLVISSLNYACTPDMVSLVDSVGGVTEATSTTAVSLSGASLTFYADSKCATPISSVTISSGNSSAPFYYEATAATTLVGSSLGLTSGNQSIVPNTSNYLGNGWYLVQSTNYSNPLLVPTPSRTAYLSQATRSGDLLVAFCVYPSTGSILSVSDNAPSGSNLYSPSNEGQLTWAVGAKSEEVFYNLNSISGATSYTLNSSVGEIGLGCGFGEFVNTGGVSPGMEAGTGAGGGDNVNSATTGGANTTVTANITTTVNGDLIFGAIWAGSTQDMNAGVGFVQVGNLGAENAINGEAETQATAGAIGVSAKILTGGSKYIIEGMAFKSP
jgi:hypothetical protein